MNMPEYKGPPPPPPAKPSTWKIDRVETFWYHSGRNSTTYVEITFWFNPDTLDRKETKRSHSCYDGEAWQRPDWAKVIITHNRSMDYDR